jgi:hypothetical protein
MSNVDNVIGGLIMTQNEFVFACVSRTLDPQLVIENDDVKEALRERDDDKVRQLLDSEY